MSSLSKTMIIGLTGGIASGKSTVVEIIKDAGYKVIDADQLVHDMQVKGGRLYQALLNWLGDGILLPNGELNRPKLGQLIFSSEEMRYQSAEIQGKIIREELAAKRDCLAKEEDVFLWIFLYFLKMIIRIGSIRFGWWRCHLKYNANA